MAPAESEPRRGGAVRGRAMSPRTNERAEVVALLAAGVSLREITRRTGVSKSTASRWSRESP